MLNPAARWKCCVTRSRPNARSVRGSGSSCPRKSIAASRPRIARKSVSITATRQDGEHPGRAAGAGFNFHRRDEHVEPGGRQLVELREILQAKALGLGQQVM